METKSDNSRFNRLTGGEEGFGNFRNSQTGSMQEDIPSNEKMVYLPQGNKETFLSKFGAGILILVAILPTLWWLVTDIYKPLTILQESVKYIIENHEKDNSQLEQTIEKIEERMDFLEREILKGK